MIDVILAEAGDWLPETFGFLHLGWYIVHIVGIPLVFLIGFAVGKKKGAKAA